MATATEYQAEIDRLNAIKERIRTNLVAQGITVPEDTVLEAMAEQILSVAGEDGYSPTVAVTAITGGHRVSITDSSGTKTFDVLDGEDADNDAVWEQINKNTAGIETNASGIKSNADDIEALTERVNNISAGTTPSSGSKFYTANDTFTVPEGITAIFVSACAAGLGIYAGEYLLDQIFNVEPGQEIDIVVGSGNTIIGDLVTLIAGAVASATPTTKLGYAAGYNGGKGAEYSGNSANTNGSKGGYGGAFGYGGGGGGNAVATAGGGGAGIGGSGGSAIYNSEGAGGGTTGGNGGSKYTDCENAKSGNLIYIGATDNGKKGGDGSIYGAGGGAGGVQNSSRGGGGAAGGYGAGGGESGRVSTTQASTIYGQPSGGMVLIEWKGSDGLSEKLPDGYIALEYLETTGTQYVDTEILISAATLRNLRVIADIEIIEKSGIFSANGSGRTYPRIYFGINQNGYIAYGNGSNDVITTTPYNQNRYIWNYNLVDLKFTVNGVYNISDITVDTSQSATRNFYIGAYAISGGAVCHYEKIYNYKFYNGNTIIRNYVPCINDSGEYGLYDTVNGKFYANAGTGSFTGG